MRYATARYNQHQRDVAYRIYISDCLRILTENTAKLSNGAYLTERYFEMLNHGTKKQYKQGEITEKIKSKFRD